MPKKKRKKSRARDASGHFKKKATRTRKKRPAAPRKTRRKARKIVRVKRALGRRPNGKFVKRRKHKVAGHTRKIARSRKRRRIAAHMSYEAAPAKPRRRRAKRRTSAVTRKKIVRVKRALGRRPNGKYVKRRKHRVAGHTRKISRTRKRRIAAHMSYEEETMPKKRRRAKRKSAAPKRRRRRAAVVVVANPIVRRHYRRKAKRRAAPKRRSSAKRRTVRRSSAKRRTAKRRSYARRAPARRRRSGRKVLASTFCRRRSKSKKPRTRYVTVSGSRRAKRTSKRKKSYVRRTPKSHRLTQGEHPQLTMFHESGVMENPLSGGELLLAAVTGTLGYALTDFLDRYLANKELATVGSSSIITPPGAAAGTGYVMSPALAALTKPGIWRILAQAGAAAVPFAAAYYVKEPMGRAALQGAGLGALVHLGSQLFTHFVVAKYFGGSAQTAGTFGATVQGLYSSEIMADNSSDDSTTGTMGTLISSGTGPTPGTLSGNPRGLGRPQSRAFNTPTAVAGVGACGPAPCGPAPCSPFSQAAAAAQAWAANPAPTPVTPMPIIPPMVVSTTTPPPDMVAAASAAAAAIATPGALNGVPQNVSINGVNLNSMFPD